MFLTQFNYWVRSTPIATSNCRHQVIPPSYEREVWHCKEAYTDLIQWSVKIFDWIRVFKNNNVNDILDICTKTIQNILLNHIPHQIITIDDKDSPWFNTKIKPLLREKNKIYKKFPQNWNIYKTAWKFYLILLNTTTILERPTI